MLYRSDLGKVQVTFRRSSVGPPAEGSELAVGQICGSESEDKEDP